MTADEFVKRFRSLAFHIEKETGFFAEALLTQAALETGWGTKVKGNNYFGIKGKRQLIRTKEVLDHPNAKFPEILSITPIEENGKTLYVYDCKTWFDQYDTPIDSFLAYTDFIKTNPRYSKALQQTTPEAYLVEVAAAGYATAPNYGNTLLKVLKSVKKRL